MYNVHKGARRGEGVRAFTPKNILCEDFFHLIGGNFIKFSSC